MTWFDLLPLGDALAQTRYERRHRVYGAVQAGVRRDEIAKRLGVTVVCVGLDYRRARSEVEAGPGAGCPVLRLADRREYLYEIIHCQGSIPWIQEIVPNWRRPVPATYMRPGR